MDRHRPPIDETGCTFDVPFSVAIRSAWRYIAGNPGQREHTLGGDGGLGKRGWLAVLYATVEAHCLAAMGRLDAHRHRAVRVAWAPAAAGAVAE
jgi:hypothetical protein